MKTKKIRPLLAAAGLLMGAFATQGAPAHAATATDFVGIWTGTDVVDGSNLLLGITRRHRVILFDDRAEVCGGEPARVAGRGTMVGDELTIPRFRIDCLGTSPDLTVPYALEFDAATGELVETVPGPRPGGVAQTYERLF